VKKKKSNAQKTTAYNSSLAKYFSRYFAKLPWSLYAIEKNHRTFFSSPEKNTLWVKARFFIINALVLMFNKAVMLMVCKMFNRSAKADGH
jgi:hypothetical protein